LKDVPRLGPKAFEQCAGFLRITNGDDPLDASGVHPESYPVVRRILAATKSDIKALIGNAEVLRQVKPQGFVDDTFGLPTVTDILRELEKPGRDPRPTFKAAVFKEGVETLKDLKPGMILEGSVTNVAAFGAFVDIGVHQDGLVHISAMSKSFIKDPREVVKSGDIVKVKVLEVEVARKRIALTLRLDDEPGGKTEPPAQGMPRDNSRASMTSSAPRKSQQPSGGGALAEALRRASEKAGAARTRLSWSEAGQARRLRGSIRPQRILGCLRRIGYPPMVSYLQRGQPRVHPLSRPVQLLNAAFWRVGDHRHDVGGRGLELDLLGDI